MSGIANYLYGGDDNVDPFAMTSQSFKNKSPSIDPFATQSNDPFASSSSNDPFAVSSDPFATPSSDPFATSNPQNDQYDPFATPSDSQQTQTMNMNATPTKEQGITSINTIYENDEEFTTEINKDTSVKMPTIAIEVETPEEQKKEVEEVKEEVTIVEVEDQSNQKIIKYFEKAFTNTFVPQLKQTENEVNELIQIQVMLDNQLKGLYEKLKEMESILSPPSYVDDLNRINLIQKRIDKLNNTLIQIETRISTLMNSRLYQKYSNQVEQQSQSQTTLLDLEPQTE